MCVCVVVYTGVQVLGKLEAVKTLELEFQAVENPLTGGLGAWALLKEQYGLLTAELSLQSLKSIILITIEVETFLLSNKGSKTFLKCIIYT